MPRSFHTTFTARVGGTAILPCPNPPGALLQYYSVIWMKDGVTIISAGNPQISMELNGDPRFDLNSAYSLVIHSVNVNDSSSNYQCEVFFTIPRTNTRSALQGRRPDNRDISLTLTVIGMHTWYAHAQFTITVDYS